MIRRPRPQLGQMPFVLPAVRDTSKPSVLLHKNGRYLLFKPQTPLAAILLNELIARISEVPEMREGQFWNINYQGERVVVKDWKKIEIWRHLAGDVSKHPLCRVLEATGVEIGVVPTLAGYIKKEWRRFQIENTNYPTPISKTNLSLFDRCSFGTNLRCIKDFIDPSNDNVIFKKDEHYAVVQVGSEGIDKVVVNRTPIRDGVELTTTGTNVWEWSEYSTSMEEYFDDSEDADLGPTVREAFPDQIAQMEKRIEALGFDLFTHVKMDSAIDALKRAAVNGKLMRMGKTSQAITTTTVWGSKKIAVFGSKNVILTWKKEFKRLGVTDYVIVDSLADLQKPGRYFLMRYSWVRAEKDKTAAERNDRTNYLRAGERTQTVKVAGSSKTVISRYSVLNHHPCPHCEQPMVRPEMRRDGTGKVYRIDWTPLYGYMCRNKECEWTTDNRKKKGAAWTATSNKLIRHIPGTYVDWGLAAHAQCSHQNVKGRMCLDCREVDGVWVPQVTKRFKKDFTAGVPDEVHNMKDPTSQTFKAVTRMRFRRKYPMTGTFISNGISDSYWILHWLFGGGSNAFPFTRMKGLKEFENRFSIFATVEKPAGIDEETGEMIKKLVRKKTPFLKNATDWWKFIAPKFLRRNYDDPWYQQSLLDAGMYKPDSEIKKIVCPMAPQQIKLMLSAMRNFKDVYEKYKVEMEAKNKDVNQQIVIAQMATMCTIATVPQALNKKLGLEVYDGPDGGGKMYNILKLTQDRLLSGGKVLIISDYVEMRRALEEQFKELGIKTIRFKGNWSTEEREEALDLYANDPDYGVMLAGTREISEALDFSVADDCICCDLLWAPAFQQQAWSRILQATKRKRNCRIYMMLSGNSIDEHKFETFYAKLMASEQSQDRQVKSRKAMTIDIKQFADRVIEEEANLTKQIRDLGMDENIFVLPGFNTGFLEERMV